MAVSQDTEITLGTGKLLVLFFGLVGICALFFAVGYTLGRKSEPSLAAASTGALQVAPEKTKASGASQAPAMTFYKSVEQKDANPELTPAVDAKTENAAAPAQDASASSNTAAQQAAAANTDMSATTLPTGATYFVQVAAVSKHEDGEALVDALKKKDYPAFVAAQSASDKLFHVQVGPFGDVKEAEAMRSRLIADGYSPILKR